MPHVELKTLRTEAFVSWESDRNKVKTEMNAYSCKAPHIFPNRKQKHVNAIDICQTNR